jgi:hypothetical protein
MRKQALRTNNEALDCVWMNGMGVTEAQEYLKFHKMESTPEEILEHCKHRDCQVKENFIAARRSMIFA